MPAVMLSMADSGAPMAFVVEATAEVGCWMDDWDVKEGVNLASSPSDRLVQRAAGKSCDD